MKIIQNSVQHKKRMGNSTLPPMSKSEEYYFRSMYGPKIDLDNYQKMFMERKLIIERRKMLKLQIRQEKLDQNYPVKYAITHSFFLIVACVTIMALVMKTNFDIISGFIASVFLLISASLALLISISLVKFKFLILKLLFFLFQLKRDAILYSFYF